MSKIPEDFRDLLLDKKAFAQVATVGKSGPQVNAFAQPGEVRVLYKITPEFVHGRG